MFRPVEVYDLELAQTPLELPDLPRFGAVRALVRLRGTPLGFVDAAAGKRITARELAVRAVSTHRAVLEKELLRRALRTPSYAFSGDPSASVAVCTRDRPRQLRRCLVALDKLRYGELEVLVVDNAPEEDTAQRIVRSEFPHFRYVREPRPGLDWARNRALLEARGEIIAYTDDDVVVDPGWVTALAAVFLESQAVAAVTGLVAPLELETRAQLLFESYGGFGRGFEREWTRVDAAAGERVARRYGATGHFGTGANMAFRREALLELGGFDPALDVGTVTQGGGDLEIFFRVLKAGHTLVREPRALVWHRHRAEYAALRAQLRTWGVGMYAYVVRSCLAFPDEVPGFLWIAARWLGLRNARRLLWTLFHDHYPRELLVDEVRGAPLAPSRYLQARSAAEAIAAEFGPLPWPPMASSSGAGTPRSGSRKREMIRLELADPLPTLGAEADVYRVEVLWRGDFVGSFSIHPKGADVPPAQLRDAVVDHLHGPLVEALGRERLAEEAGPPDGILRRLLFPRSKFGADAAVAIS
ncbi:hypothetical protein BH23GEM4_BH23GEM4_23240 [soil metagenome]